jgi:hypothetical protein
VIPIAGCAAVVDALDSCFEGFGHDVVVVVVAAARVAARLDHNHPCHQSFETAVVSWNLSNRTDLTLVFAYK